MKLPLNGQHHLTPLLPLYKLLTHPLNLTHPRDQSKIIIYLLINARAIRNKVNLVIEILTSNNLNFLWLQKLDYLLLILQLRLHSTNSRSHSNIFLAIPLILAAELELSINLPSPSALANRLPLIYLYSTFNISIFSQLLYMNLMIMFITVSTPLSLVILILLLTLIHSRPQNSSISYPKLILYNWFTFPTHSHSNTLNLIIWSPDSLIISSIYTGPPLSDHLDIFFPIYLNSSPASNMYWYICWYR